MTSNNLVTISGYIDDFIYDHTAYDERFLSSHIRSERTSGTIDNIPVIASEILVNKENICSGKYVEIKGEFRSMNVNMGERNKVVLYIFVKKIQEISKKVNDENEIFIDGFLVKQPTYRETPYGREISDMTVAINRRKGKSDYIPCICWGRNAKFANSLVVGTHLKIQGRIQSREYYKQLSDGCSERRTAYEVSMSKMEVVNDENSED